MEVVLVIVAVAAIVLVLGASLWAGGHPKRGRDRRDAVDDTGSDPASMLPLMALGGSPDEGQPRHSDDDRGSSHGVDGTWNSDASTSDVGGDAGGSSDAGGDGGGSGD
jgi:hypothetical protein